MPDTKTIILEIQTNQKIIDDAKLSAINYKKAITDLRGELKKEGVDTDAINKKLVTRQNELKKTNDNLREITKIQKLNNTIVKSAKGSYDQLNAQLLKSKLQWKALSQEQRENSKRGRELTSQQKTLTTQLKKLDAQTGVHNRKVASYTKSLLSLGKTLIGGLGLIQGFRALFNILKGGIQNTIEFEQALSSLSAITGLVGKNLANMAQTAIQFSSDTLKSAKDIVKAFELVGSIRPELLKDADALAEVTKNAIILSEATGGALGLEDAARSTAGGLNQFSLASTKANKLINVLAAGSKFGTATILEQSEAIKVFGTVADDANITIEKANGLMQTLAKRTIVGTEAGTALRNVILRLQKAGLGYVDGLFDINAALIELKGENRTAIELTKLFGDRTITAGRILLNNTDLIDSYTEAVTGTNTALEQQRIQNNNLGASLTKLANQWETNTLALQGSTGGIKDFVDNLTDALSVLGDQSFRGEFLARLFGAQKEDRKAFIEELEHRKAEFEKLSVEELNRLLSTEQTKSDKLEEIGSEFEKLQAARSVRIIEARIKLLNDEIAEEERLKKDRDDKNELARQANLEAEENALNKKNEKELKKTNELIQAKSEARNAEFEAINEANIERALLEFEANELNNEQIAAANQDLFDFTEALKEEAVNNDIARLENERQREIAAINASKADEEAKGKALLAINTKYDKAISAMQDIERRGRLAATAKTLGDAGNLFEKHTLAYKVLASAEAGINTFLSATAAYKSVVGIPIVGPVLAPIAAATAVAAGLKSIAEINAINIPTFSKGTVINKKGQMLNGPSHAEGGIKLYGEGEGGEPVLTKSVMSNPVDASIISAINVKHGGIPLYHGNTARYAAGGVTTEVEAAKVQIVYQPVLIYEDVQDIKNTQQQIKVMESL